MIEEKMKIEERFIGHPSMIFKKLLNKSLKNFNEKLCAIFKTFHVQDYFSLKDEAPLGL